VAKTASGSTPRGLSARVLAALRAADSQADWDLYFADWQEVVADHRLAVSRTGLDVDRHAEDRTLVPYSRTY